MQFNPDESVHIDGTEGGIVIGPSEELGDGYYRVWVEREFGSDGEYRDIHVRHLKPIYRTSKIAVMTVAESRQGDDRPAPDTWFTLTMMLAMLAD